MNLDPQQIETHLKQPSLPLYLFETVTSTNQIASDLLEEGKPPPIIVIAAQQTAGRGQWGRTWVSSVGGLYLSIGLKLQIEATDAAHLTLFTAWGIAQRLRTHELRVNLKWPNDLILEGRKLGGIKSETRVQQGMITQGIIGVGINWHNRVPETGITIQSYQKPHQIRSLEELAAITINGVLEGYEYYLAYGIEALLKNYVEMLDNVGRKVMIEGMTGMIIGVTAQGELEVSLEAPGAKTTVKLPPGTISLGYL